MTEPQLGGTYEELLAAAHLAEDLGLASFARSDHYYSGRRPAPAATDAFATLAGLARDTERIRVCVLVSPVTFRHPAVIAKNAATIDEMSGGRLDLGMGTGWMDAEHEAFGIPIPPWPERFARLEEALQYVTAAFASGEGSFTGDYYSLDAQVHPTPTGPIPLIVGGSGAERTPRLAGTYADEYNHFVAPPDVLAPKIARARQAAAEAGRDPDELRVSIMGPVVAGRDEASYGVRLANRAAARDTDPDEYQERLVDAGVPVGPPPRVAEAFEALTELGVDRFYVQHLDLGDLEPLSETFEVLLRL
jgi:alkanesulfonate monooxygenase SsuD/methylene tetrahydromethanopterin reductase-like flavin-dependent oxidoreductase (luciferase family)